MEELPEDVLRTEICCHMSASTLSVLRAVNREARSTSQAVVNFRLECMIGAGRLMAIPRNKRILAMCLAECRQRWDLCLSECMTTGGTYFPGGFFLDVVTPERGNVVRLSFSDDPFTVTLPLRVCGLDDIPVIEASAGRLHSLALDATGGVWSWGSGASSQLGHGSEVQQLCVPRRIQSLEGIVVVQVAAGGDASMTLSQAGRVYSFGQGEAGTLGHDALHCEPCPRRIESLVEPVRSVAMGTCHALAVTVRGTAFWWGRHYGHHRRSALDEMWPGLVRRSGEVPRPIPVCVPGTTVPIEQVVRIAVGSTHGLLMAEDGTLFSVCTQSEFGSRQLGCASSNLQTAPALPALRDLVGIGRTLWICAMPIAVPDGRAVAQIACGTHHSCVLTRDGEVFTFGDGTNGALGHGGTQSELTPRRVEDLPGAATSVVCGGLFTIVKVSSGDLYGFGGFSQAFETAGTPVHLKYALQGRQDKQQTKEEICSHSS